MPLRRDGEYSLCSIHLAVLRQPTVSQAAFTCSVPVEKRLFGSLHGTKFGSFEAKRVAVQGVFFSCLDECLHIPLGMQS